MNTTQRSKAILLTGRGSLQGSEMMRIPNYAKDNVMPIEILATCVQNKLIRGVFINEIFTQTRRSQFP
jgi:hypothetical protein